jgi:hypothetical protein
MKTASIIASGVLDLSGWDVSVVHSSEEIPEPVEGLLYTKTYEDVIFRGAQYLKTGSTPIVSRGRHKKTVDEELMDLIKGMGLLRTKREWELRGKHYVSWHNPRTTLMLDMEYDPRVPVHDKPNFYAGSIRLSVFSGAPPYSMRRFVGLISKATINCPNNHGTVNPTELYKERFKGRRLESANDDQAAQEDIGPLGQEISRDALQGILMMKQGYGSFKIN